MPCPIRQSSRPPSKLTPERRPAYLDQACGTNHELRREVESLLAAHDQPGSFLESRLGLAACSVEEPFVTEKLGTVMGSYKLLQQLGEGGMGAVSMAEQERPANRGTAEQSGSVHLSPSGREKRGANDGKRVDVG